MSGFARLSLESLETRETPAIGVSPTSFSFSATAGGASPAESSGTGRVTAVAADPSDQVDYSHVDLYKNVWINQTGSVNDIGYTITFGGILLGGTLG